MLKPGDIICIPLPKKAGSCRIACGEADRRYAQRT
jgi:hypothetical protein